MLVLRCMHDFEYCVGDMVEIPVCAGDLVFHCSLKAVVLWCLRCNGLFLYELHSQCLNQTCFYGEKLSI
jgi:hypothetical protein